MEISPELIRLGREITRLLDGFFRLVSLTNSWRATDEERRRNSHPVHGIRHDCDECWQETKIFLTTEELREAMHCSLCRMRKMELVARRGPIWECWRGDGELIVATPNEIRAELDSGLIEAGSVHVYTLVAHSWEEAMTAHHEAQGWEPYKPFACAANE